MLKTSLLAFIGAAAAVISLAQTSSPGLSNADVIAMFKGVLVPAVDGHFRLR